MMRHASRGFTLLEMMVAVLLASIGSFAIFSIMTGQMQAHYDQTRVGDAQANARMAMDLLSTTAESAGFGIPMSFTFNAANEIDTAPAGDPYSTCPGTDVFEIRSRDPRGTWTVDAASNSTTLALAPIGFTDLRWPSGQRLMIFLGAGKVATLQTSASRALNLTTVALKTASSVSYGTAADPVPTGDECNMVVVSRFRVSCVDPAHKTLVMENDTDINGDGKVDATDLLPVANDIDDFQVVYFIDADANNQLDATEQAAPVAASAVTNWQLVKGVRLSVIAMSPNQGAPGQTVPSAPMPLENHTPTATPDYYFRRLMQETVVFSNLNPAKPAYQHMSNRFL
jgi:prepilin-type N-terminal cleavage/methylation domain-containing protein